MIQSFTKSIKEAFAGKRSQFSSALLVSIKAIHTSIWFVFVGCIFGIWAFAWRGDIPHALILIGVVCVEVFVLGLNGGQCPIVAMVRRLTSDPRSNFDIYLPAWLAGHTKLIFGSLFLGGVVFTAFRWGFAPR